MSILVTGGTGFIGTRLVNALTSQGETVHILDLAPVSSCTSANPNVVYFTGTITDRAIVESAMTGCDRVFHLAAYALNWAPEEETYYDINVHGVEVILSVAKELNVRRIVHTSSNVALGPSNGVQVDEHSPRTGRFFTPYEEWKYYSEQLVQKYVEDGLDVVIVNPSRVFGPGPLNESNSVT